MIGNNIIELNRVDSTNAYAARLPATEDIDGTVIWAHDQYAGRGQHDHAWNSEPGKNLTITVCLRPKFLAPERQFQLNKAVALGVLDFVRSLLPQSSGGPYPESSIKWPNDIYAGNRKIGGILIEHRIMGPTLDASFAGIGVNINQAVFPPDISNPVSLFSLIGHETDARNALPSLCRFLNTRYQEIQARGMTNTDTDYNQSLLGFEQWREFLFDGKKVEGKITGVDQTGRLLVEHRNGETLCYSHGEILYII